MPLPALPAPSGGASSWSSNVLQACKRLTSMHDHAMQVLQTNGEMHRIQFHIQTIMNDALPILLALEGTAEYDGLSVAWLHDCSQQFVTLIDQLRSAEDTARGM